ATQFLAMAEDRLAEIERSSSEAIEALAALDAQGTPPDEAAVDHLISALSTGQCTLLDFPADLVALMPPPPPRVDNEARPIQDVSTWDSGDGGVSFSVAAALPATFPASFVLRPRYEAHALRERASPRDVHFLPLDHSPAATFVLVDPGPDATTATRAT